MRFRSSLAVGLFIASFIANDALSATAATRQSKQQPFEALQRVAATIGAEEWKAWPETRIPLLSRKEAEAFGCAGVTGPVSVVDTWNGAAFDGRRLWFHGGGHADYGCNEFYRLDLWTGEFKRLNDPSPLDQNNDWMPFSGPPATHTYGGFIYHKGLGKLLVFGRVAYQPSGRGLGPNIAWSLDPISLDGRPIRNPASGAVAAVELPNSRILLRMTGNRAVVYDPIKEEVLYERKSNLWFDGGTPVLDTERRRVWIIGGYSGIFWIGYDLETSNISPDHPVISPKEMPQGFNGNIGAALHSRSGKLVLWNGERATAVFDPASSAIKVYENARSPAAPSRGGSKGVFTKWLYIPEADVFVGYNNFRENVWLYRGPEIAR